MAINTKRPTNPVSAPSAGSESEWEDAADINLDRDCVFMDITGDTSTGRTHLAMTAPGPIAYAHASEKMEGLVKEAFERDPRIKIHNFGGVFTGSNQSVSDLATPKWEKVKRLLNGAIDGGWARTAITDTGSELWELCRLSHFGTLKPEGRIDNLYGKVNADWRQTFKRFRAQNSTNLITIHQTKDEYIERIVQGKKVSARTGRLVRAGMKEMSFLADVVIRTGRTDSGDFTATITKGWFNALSEGTEFVGDDCRFSYIMSFITGEDEAKWAK